MAAATVEEIRAGIAANLTAVYGQSVNVQPYQQEAVFPPLIEVVGVTDITYDMLAGNGLDDITMMVQGFPGLINQGAQILMDTWLGRGTGSVKNAIEVDRTLGGKIQNLTVTSASGQKPMKNTDGTFLLNCERQR